MVVECVLNCPLARNALEAVGPHRPGVDALGMIIGGAVLQSDAGMHFLFFLYFFFLPIFLFIWKTLNVFLILNPVIPFSSLIAKPSRRSFLIRSL